MPRSKKDKKQKRKASHARKAARCCPTPRCCPTSGPTLLQQSAAELACVSRFNCPALNVGLNLLTPGTSCIAVLVKGVWITGTFVDRCGDSIRMQARVAGNGCPPIPAGMVGVCYDVFIACCDIDAFGLRAAPGSCAACNTCAVVPP